MISSVLHPEAAGGLNAAPEGRGPLRQSAALPFQDLLAGMNPLRPEADSAASVEERARDAATRFVGTAFIQPMLAQLRESPFATGPFAPTDVEKRFGPMHDAMISDRLAQATNFPLADAVADHLLRTLGNHASQPPTPHT